MILRRIERCSTRSSLKQLERLPMLDTIVNMICLVWAIEVVAALLMYVLVLFKLRSRQAEPA